MSAMYVFWVSLARLKRGCKLATSVFIGGHSYDGRQSLCQYLKLLEGGWRRLDWRIAAQVGSEMGCGWSLRKSQGDLCFVLDCYSLLLRSRQSWSYDCVNSNGQAQCPTWVDISTHGILLLLALPLRNNFNLRPPYSFQQHQ